MRDNFIGPRFDKSRRLGGVAYPAVGSVERVYSRDDVQNRHLVLLIGLMLSQSRHLAICFNVVSAVCYCSFNRPMSLIGTFGLLLSNLPFGIFRSMFPKLPFDTFSCADIPARVFSG